MTTGEGGSAAADNTTTNDASSSYGEGGVGGKSRKKPFRGRQSTPYDRPSTAIRPNRSDDINRSGWLAKIVLDPATKLISYGADRIFSSVFRRKQLPPPLEDVKDDVNYRDEDVVSNYQSREQEPDRGQHSPLIDVPTGDSISDLEQLLKQKTFTRDQIMHLTELLRSRAKELHSSGNEAKETMEMLSKLASDSLEENRTNGVRSASVSTSLLKSKVLDNIASPAELAKSYMASIPSKVLPSSLAMRSQTVREVSGLLGNTPFASKSSNMSLSKKMFRGLDAPENGFITPSSRGKSDTYNMARTPYSRLYSASTLKGSGLMSNEYAVPPITSATPYLVDPDDKLVKHTSLKRRNTVLDDGVGSIGPIRRIRQKTNLLAPRIHHAAHGMVTQSDMKQKGRLISESMHDIKGTVKKNDNQTGPSTSYAHVPSKSSEVAARIFKQLEKLSPNEKSSQSKFVAARENSHLELKPSMLSGQALRSMDNAESIKIFFDGEDDHELPDRSYSGLTGARASSSKKQVNEVKNVTGGSVTLSDALNCATNAAGPSFDVEKVNVPQQIPKDKTFRMSAEVSLEQDDDILPNGFAQGPSSEGGLMLAPFSDSKLMPTEKPESVKLMDRTEEKPSSFKINETCDPGTATLLTTASESLILPPSASASGKLKETNNPPPLFSFSSTVADKFSSFSSESKEKRESEMANSLLNFPESSSREMSSEHDKADHLNSVRAGVANAKSENMPPVQSDAPQFARPLSSSFAVAFSSDTNRTPMDGGLSITSSATVASFAPSVTSTPVSSGPSIFGSASNTTEPIFRFGAPGDQIATASAAPLTNVSENLKRKMDSDSSSVSLSAFATSAPTSSGSGTSSLFSSFSNSTAGKFTDAAKSPLFSSAGTSSQGTSTDDTGKQIVEKEPSLNVSKNFGMSSSASSDASTVSSSSNSTPAPFSFGLNPSSSITNPGTSSVAAPSTFVFGGNSSVSSSLTTTASAFTSGTSGNFNIGTTSSPSNIFGSSWQGAKPSSGFGSTSTTASLSPFTGFSFAASSTASSASSTTSISPQSIGLSIGAPSTPSASTNTFPSTGFTFGASSSSSSSAPLTTSSLAAGFVFGASSTPFTSSSSTGFSLGASSSTPIASSTNISPTFFTSSTGTAKPSSIFPFATASSSTSFTQPAFGASPFAGFGTSQGNSNNQMNGDDTMAEDTVQETTPSFPVCGQTSSNAGFSFGSTAPSQGNPFVFGGQQQNQPAPFQGSGSAQFNAGGGFSLGSGGPGGGDKSGRKIVKINRNKHRKK